MFLLTVSSEEPRTLFCTDTERYSGTHHRTGLLHRLHAPQLGRLAYRGGGAVITRLQPSAYGRSSPDSRDDQKPMIARSSPQICHRVARPKKPFFVAGNGDTMRKILNRENESSLHFILETHHPGYRALRHIECVVKFICELHR